MGKAHWIGVPVDDVAGILAISGSIDVDYVDRWARVLRVENAWRHLPAGAR